MDFDDLEEEAERRLAQGEEVLGHVVLNRQPPKGTVLPPMPRSFRVPSDTMLPSRVQATLPPRSGEKLKERLPKLRLLCMYGAGDSINQEWCYMQHDAPEFVEMATHELPGHGTRSKEAPKTTLQEVVDDAFEGFKEAMETGVFAVIGHSIGCLIATGLCERAKRELNVEPLYAIMIERGAAHFPVHSEFGLNLLRTRPLDFLKIYSPPTAKAIETFKAADKEKTGEGWKHVLDMWGNDLQIENDTREVGWYKFPCPVLAFNSPVTRFRECSQEQLKEAEPFRKIRTERDYLGHFAPEHFEAWSEWTEHPDGAAVVPVDADHFGIKRHERCRRRIWADLEKLFENF